MNSFDFKSLKTSSSNDQHFTSTSSLPKSYLLTGTNHTSNNTQIPSKQILTKGLIIQAEVIDLRGKDIKIQLNNSEIISGKISSDVPLSIGEQVTFQVEDASLTSISLKVMADNRKTSQSIIIDKALEDANLPKTERSIQIVQELLNNQMSIDKESLQKLYLQSITFKNTSIQTLVFMNKYGIELNDINTAQFEAYQNYEHRLVNGFTMLINNLLEALPQASEGVAIKLNEFLLTLSTSQMTADNALIADTSAKATFSTITTKEAMVNNDNQLSTSLMTSEIMEQLFANNSVNASDPNTSVKHELPTMMKNFATQDINMNEDTTVTLDTLMEDSFQTVIPKDYDTLPISNFLDINERTALIQAFPTELQKTIEERLMEPSFSIKDTISEIITNLNSLNAPQLQNLFETSGYHTLIKEALLSKWTLTPKMLKNQKGIDDFYSQLQSDFKEMIDFFNEATDASSNRSFENAGKQAQNLQDNIDFMKTLNQIFPYVQLPMKLSTQNAHSELYVYKRKKTSNKDSNSISVLLHLDMEQLGPLDIHLDLIKTHINTKIYTDNKDTKLLFDGNINLLKTTLENKGYNFTYEVVKRVKEKELVQEITKTIDPGIGMKRYSFDIRA